jgi:hypothetical protein
MGTTIVIVLIAMALSFAVGAVTVSIYDDIHCKTHHVGSLNYQKNPNGSYIYWIEFDNEKAMESLNDYKEIILDVSEAR